MNHVLTDIKVKTRFCLVGDKQSFAQNNNPNLLQFLLTVTLGKNIL